MAPGRLEASKRPWDCYPLWKKALVAVMLPFAGTGSGFKKITVLGVVFMILGSMAWGFNASMYPFAMCLEDTIGNEETNIERDKNLTVYEHRLDQCIKMDRCADESGSDLIRSIFLPDFCETYLENQEQDVNTQGS